MSSALDIKLRANMHRLRLWLDDAISYLTCGKIKRKTQMSEDLAAARIPGEPPF